MSAPAGIPVTERILVVDDVAEMRALLRRVLASGGYRVDVAATLAEARALDPGSYAGVLIDDHLGLERGTDLIEELCAADPGAARRCLVVTGQGATIRADGVAVLAKPFKPADLLDAVSTLCRPGAVGAPGGSPGPDPGQAATGGSPGPDPGQAAAATGASPGPDRGEARPAPQPPEATRPTAPDGPSAWRLLAITRRLRDRERRDLADFLHDGPIQNLTAATLEMQLLRRPEVGERVDAALGQLSLAADALHRLVDEDSAFLQPEASLADTLRRRTAWLLAEPLVVEADGASAALAPGEVAAVADMVEMMLLGAVPTGRRLQARVSVHAGSPADRRTTPGTRDGGTPPPGTTPGTGDPGARRPDGDRLIRLGLALTPAARDDQPIGDPGSARAALRELAAALQATPEARFEVRHWQVGLAVWTGHLPRFADQRFAGLLEAAPDAMVCVAVGGRIVLANAQAERLFGYPRGELVGRPVELLVPDAVRSQHRRHRAGYLADPQPRPMGVGLELAARRRDGSTFPADVSLSAVDTDEGLLVTVAVRDLTERLAVQAEHERLKAEAARDNLEHGKQQAQRLESLGQLAGGVAHDFNNLLAVISSYAAFVREEVAKDPSRISAQAVREDIDQVDRAAQRAAGLTHQLLAFARREVLQPHVLHLNEVIVDLTELLTRTLGEQVELITRLADDLGPVEGDRGQVEQILVNLAVNARDAMPMGGTLVIETANTQVRDASMAGHTGIQPGQYVQVKVSDTGAGIPRDLLDRAFEPFFTTKPEGERPGLGLATVYGLVKQAGGDVRIDSGPRVGTTLTVLLPICDSAGLPEPPPPRPPERGQGETVLLVEDEPAMREMARRMLHRNGYRVLAAASGQAALDLVAGQQGPIDVLLTDVVMPQMQGKELADRIRALRPGIRVLFMSGYPRGLLGAQGILDSGISLIEKPFPESALLSKMREVLATP